MTVDTDILIIGAGLAGLVAACECADAGKKVIVLDQEGEQSLGGQAFWSFGGFGKPVKNKDHFWKEGDDLTGDPPMEEQGLNSVFATDTSTWQLINKYTLLLRK